MCLPHGHGFMGCMCYPHHPSTEEEIDPHLFFIGDNDEQN